MLYQFKDESPFVLEEENSLEDLKYGESALITLIDCENDSQNETESEILENATSQCEGNDYHP